MTTQEERNLYFNKFLDDLFFKDWRKGRRQDGFYNNLELIITPDCNLACKYCYINRYGNLLYPRELLNSEKIKANTSMLLDWLIDNKLVPRYLEIFSGSVFSQQIGWDVLEIIYDKYKNIDEELKPFGIIIPTNFTFILDDEITSRVENLLERFRAIEMPIFLSGSIEGKYMEQNRPFKKNLKQGQEIGQHLYIPNSKEPRDDEYYDKVFQFCKKYRFGFHPMVYSKGIELWKKNFVWYQEMLKKHNIPFNSVMLLEVRNEEWTEEEVREFSNFIEFAVDYIYNEVFNCNDEQFVKTFRESKILNTLLDSCIGENVNSGISCSIQEELFVRLGDLHIVPCHRTSYAGLEYGKFITSQNKIQGIEALNVELATQILTFNHKTLPMCQSCAIREVCNQTCLGSNLETKGELFSPSPTVCRLEYARIVGAIKALENIGLADTLIGMANKNRTETYWLLRNKLWE